MKIMLMGPLTNRKDPLMTSGTITLFKELILQLKKNNIEFTVIDINKKNYVNFIFAYLSIFIQMLYKQRGCSHISLHSSRDYMVLGSVVIFFGKLFNRQTSLRKFGGEASKVYKESKGIKRKLLRFIFSNINLLFFETKHMVVFFTEINPNTYWFPNVRNRVMQPTLPRSYKKKFVFIGGVKHEKGIDEIIEATKKLDKSYIIDIYGPIYEDKYTKEYFKKCNVSYKGALKADEVLETLNKYDVLLLPTYYKGEGYPGIIIEAYSLGIPILATTLHGIKEIVDIHKTGVLIEPKNVEELVSAVKYFNKENYVRLSENAYKKFDDFKSDIQTKLFLELLN